MTGRGEEMAGSGEEMAGAEVHLCIIQWGLGHMA